MGFSPNYSRTVISIPEIEGMSKSSASYGPNFHEGIAALLRHQSQESHSLRANSSPSLSLNLLLDGLLCCLKAQTLTPPLQYSHRYHLPHSP